MTDKCINDNFTTINARITELLIAIRELQEMQEVVEQLCRHEHHGDKVVIVREIKWKE